MPYVSARQRRYMKGCEHSPGKMRGKCPPKSVLRKFAAHKGARRGR